MIYKRHIALGLIWDTVIIPEWLPPSLAPLLADSLGAEKATWLHMADTWDLTGVFVCLEWRIKSMQGAA